MNFLDKELQQYSETHTSGETDLLKRISRETYVQVMNPRMLSGHLQGRFLAMISCMMKPKFILEIGTFTGYSAICLAEGLAPGGKLITIDINEELEEKVRGYLKEAGLEKAVDYRIGDASKIIPLMDLQFDLVFLDADKESYGRYFDLVVDKISAGGFIIADNVLWNGKVLDHRPDKDTRVILEFNDKVHNDPRVENVLLPVRDGLMIMRKKQILDSEF